MANYLQNRLIDLCLSHFDKTENRRTLFRIMR